MDGWVDEELFQTNKDVCIYCCTFQVKSHCGGETGFDPKGLSWSNKSLYSHIKTSNASAWRFITT